MTMCIPMPFGLKRVCVSAATMPPVRGRAGGEVGGADAMLDSLSDGGEGAMSHRRILPRSCTQASTDSPRKALPGDAFGMDFGRIWVP